MEVDPDEVLKKAQLGLFGAKEAPFCFFTSVYYWTSLLYLLLLFSNYIILTQLNPASSQY